MQSICNRIKRDLTRPPTLPNQSALIQQLLQELTSISVNEVVDVEVNDAQSQSPPPNQFLLQNPRLRERRRNVVLDEVCYLLYILFRFFLLYSFYPNIC